MSSSKKTDFLFIQDFRLFINKKYLTLKKNKFWVRFPILVVSLIIILWISGSMGHWGKTIQDLSIGLLWNDSSFSLKNQSRIVEDNRVFQEKMNELNVADQSVATYLIMALNFNVNGEQGILGEGYTDGSKIELDLSLSSTPAFLMFINLDRNGIHTLGSIPKSVMEVEETQVSLSYYLDNQTHGVEIVYAIGSQNTFDYSEIEATITKAQKAISEMKGGFNPMTLKLPAKFSQSNVYFRRIKK